MKKLFLYVFLGLLLSGNAKAECTPGFGKYLSDKCWQYMGDSEVATVYFDYKDWKSLKKDDVDIFHHKNVKKGRGGKKTLTLLANQLIIFNKPQDNWRNAKSAEIHLEIYCERGWYSFKRIILYEDTARDTGEGKILLDSKDEKLWPKGLQTGIHVANDGVRWATAFKDDEWFKYLQFVCRSNGKNVYR